MLNNCSSVYCAINPRFLRLVVPVPVLPRGSCLEGSAPGEVAAWKPHSGTPPSFSGETPRPEIPFPLSAGNVGIIHTFAKKIHIGRTLLAKYSIPLSCSLGNTHIVGSV